MVGPFAIIVDDLDFGRIIARAVHRVTNGQPHLTLCLLEYIGEQADFEHARSRG
jgi:hypothetical protein